MVVVVYAGSGVCVPRFRVVFLKKQKKTNVSFDDDGEEATSWVTKGQFSLIGSSPSLGTLHFSRRPRQHQPPASVYPPPPPTSPRF